MRILGIVLALFVLASSVFAADENRDYPKDLKLPNGKVRVRRADLDADVAEAADLTREAAGQLHRLVSDVLELSRIESGTAELQVRETDLRAMVREVVAADAQVGVWTDDEYYSQFVEFGTSKMAAQPFMYPNARRANRKVRGWVREGIDKRVGD